MRHPLTGGGMTVAFNDAVVLRDLLSPEKVPRFADTKLVMKQMSSFHWERKRFASVINILAQSLYSVFCADDPNLRVLQRGCFQYFQLGRIEGPIGLLAGLVKEPLVLFWHFCSVAFLSIWCLFTEAPFYQLPVVILRSISVFWTACIVIVPYMLSEMKR